MKQHAELLKKFEKHLRTLGYAEQTVSNASVYTTEFFNFLEKHSILLNKTSNTILKNYFNYLQKRKNTRRGGALSNGSLQKHRQSIRLFFEFLHAYFPNRYPSLDLPVFKKSRHMPTMLSKEEVKRLFAACTDDFIGKRDAALLALYYGCGLRKQEGILLTVNDIDFAAASLLVTKSKTNEQRFVPLADWVIKILEDYTFNVREKLIPMDKSTKAFLVSEIGKQLSPSTVVAIFQKLITKAKITTPASLHTLRHSIATHLLNAGMKLENIAQFLGHKSLDSTQIYTHINHS